jgi:D-3-phosphoglycerate dehydrogenase / 2-oxoglutarate reductase
MKVLLIDTMHPSFSKMLIEKGIEVVEGYHLSREEILASINTYSGIAIRSRFKLDASFLDAAAGSVKVIGRAGAGMENIDVKHATKLGIQCVNAPEGNRDAVGEHAIGMLLMLMNHLRRADAEVRNGIWRREENRGDELEGKTIGLIGFGNMGSAFARRLTGFGVRILVVDPYITFSKEKLPHVEQVDMATLQREADVVSLHVPLTDETRNMINRQWFAALSKPIWFINTARGKNLVTADLTEAIENGIVRGAALDVLEYEAISFEKIDAASLPLPFQYLVKSDRVVLSPHIAGWTHESNEKIARFLAQKMIAVLT